jgi:hypothetical protein
MTVAEAGIPVPNSAGSRKNIQKMIIKSGIPRIIWMTELEVHRIRRFREMLKSPRTSPPTKEKNNATTDKYRVSPTPPSGPLG